MATKENEQAKSEQFPGVEVRWCNPDDLEQSHLYNDDASRGGANLSNSINTKGVLQPTLGRVEDGAVRVFDGWRRVKGARNAGKDSQCGYQRTEIGAMKKSF